MGCIDLQEAFTDECIKIRKYLKKNPHGMNIREISHALGINRNSVAKYLEILTSREEVDIKIFGKSKVYFLSQHVPISRLLDYSSQNILILNRDLRIVQVNKTLLLSLNRNKECVIGKSVHELGCDFVNNDTVIGSLPLVFKGQELTEELVVGRDEMTSHYRIILTPTRFPDHSPGIILMCKDVTDNKKIEIALQESEEKYRSFIEESGDGCTIVDDKGLVIDWNRAEETITGISRGEAVGRPLIEIIEMLMHRDLRSNKRIAKRKSMVHSMLCDVNLPCFTKPVEIRISRRDGEDRIIQHTTFPIQLAKKRHFGVIMRDVTDRKKMELSLEQKTAFLSSLLDSIPDIVFFKNSRGEYLGCNPEFARHVGLPREEIIGCTDYDLYPRSVADTFRKNDRAVMDDGMPRHYEEVISYPDGRQVIVDTFKSRLSCPVGILAVSRDISERKRAEDLIRKSEERFEQVADSANEWIWEVDTDGCYRYCSTAVEHILGYAPEELVGKVHYHELFEPSVREDLRRIVDSEFRKRTPFRKFINPNVHKNGGIVILETSGTPIFDSRGEFSGYRGCDNDITEFRNMEKTRHAALQQIERNIAQFAVLGDHIRNPLTVILALSNDIPAEIGTKIAAQVWEIERIIREIDQGWIESESIRSFIKKHYGLSPQGNTGPGA